LSGVGIELLVDRLAKRIVPESLDDGTAVPFTDRQVNAIDDACRRMQCGKPASAAAVLRGLLQ
jgi:hypothetical protein